MYAIVFVSVDCEALCLVLLALQFTAVFVCMLVVARESFFVLSILAMLDASSGLESAGPTVGAGCNRLPSSQLLLLIPLGQTYFSSSSACCNLSLFIL